MLHFGHLALVVLAGTCVLSGAVASAAPEGLNGIREIQMNTSGRLTVVQTSAEEGIEVLGAPEVRETVTWQQLGGTLIIDALESGYTALPAAMPEIRVTVKDLRAIEVKHHGRVQVEGLQSPKLSLRIQGDGQVYLANTRVERLGISIGGQGRVTLDGFSGERLRGELNGQGQISARALDVDHVSLRIAGHGAANLEGRSVSKHVRIEGHGALAATDLACNESSLSIEGHGRAMVWTEGALNLDVQHHGSVQYRGAPVVLSARETSAVSELVGGV